MLMKPASNGPPTAERLIRGDSSDRRRKITSSVPFGVVRDRSPREIRSPSNVGQADERVRFNPINLHASSPKILNGGRDSLIYGLRLAREFHDDVALLERNRRIVTAGIEESSLEVVQRRMQSRVYDGEFKRFHLLPVGASVNLMSYLLRMVASALRGSPDAYLASVSVGLWAEDPSPVPQGETPSQVLRRS